MVMCMAVVAVLVCCIVAAEVGVVFIVVLV